jgi:replicative DNA helicase
VVGVQLSEPQPESPIACIDVEQELLGAILNNNEACDIAAQFIVADDFFEPIHRKLFASFVAARHEGRAITITLAKAVLGGDAKIELMPGCTVGQYIARLAASATTIINAPDFAKTIREFSDRRKMDSVADAIKEGARSFQVQPSAISIEGVAALDEIAVRYADKHTARVGVGGAAERSISRMAEAMQNKGRITGISTGLRDLDAKTNGLQRGELIVLAGRPGMGKSGLAVSSLRQSEANSIYFSLEMGAESLADRILSDMVFDHNNPVPYFDIARGSLSMEAAERVTDAARALHGSRKIEIDPQGGLTMGQIAARARKHKQFLERQGKTLDVVCVDHMHITRPSARYSGNRVSELTEISGSLKALAKELNVAVLALAQLNRTVETRDDKRPMLSDLRDSGAIEQDADLIIFLYREAYYLERMISADAKQEEGALDALVKTKNELEAIIAKQRNGPTCTVKLFCNIACNAIRDMARVAA